MRSDVSISVCVLFLYGSVWRVFVRTVRTQRVILGRKMDGARVAAKLLDLVARALAPS